jgi:glycosyltransferase involved in cell wall biosynthesis
VPKQKEGHIFRVGNSSWTLDVLLRGQANFLQKNGWKSTYLGNWPNRKAGETFQIDGAQCVQIPISRILTPVQDIIAWSLCFIWIARKKPKIIHAFTTKASLLWLVAGFIMRTPVRIYEVTGLKYQSERGWKRSLLRLTDKLNCKLATHVVPVGLSMKNVCIRELSVPAKKIHSIGYGSSNGLDTSYWKAPTAGEKINWRRRYGIAEERFVFTFIGKVVREKGVEELIHAFTQLNRMESTRPVLLIAGPIEPHIDPLSESTMQTLLQHPDIVYLGYQEKVFPLLALCDCLVLPSYREGLPMVVIEALAMELPVIATDIPATLDALNQGEFGYPVPPYSSRTLLETMQKICKAEPRIKARPHARPWVIEHFEQSQFWNQLLNFYSKLT